MPRLSILLLALAALAAGCIGTPAAEEEQTPPTAEAASRPVLVFEEPEPVQAPAEQVEPAPQEDHTDEESSGRGGEACDGSISGPSIGSGNCQDGEDADS